MSINQYDIENGSFVSLLALRRPVHNIVNKLENEVARRGDKLVGDMPMDLNANDHVRKLCGRNIFSLVLLHR